MRYFLKKEFFVFKIFIGIRKNLCDSKLTKKYINNDQRFDEDFKPPDQNCINF